MADSKKVVLFELDIDIASATKDTRALKQSLELLTEKAKEAKEANGDLSDEYLEYQAAMKLTKKEIRDTEKITQELIDAETNNIKSIKSLRNENKLLNKERNDLNLETEEGQKRLTELNTKLDENNKLIKESSDAYTQQKINIGNYPDTLGQITTGLDKASGGFLSMAKSALVFIATPIGAVLAAIVGVFKLLQGAFSRSLESQEKLNKITGKLSAAFGVLLDFLTPVVDFILDKVIGAFEAMGKAVVYVIDKLVDWGIVSEESSSKFKKSMDKSTKAADDLASAERRLVENNIALQKAQLKYQRQAEILRQLRDDESRSIDDRIKSNTELGKLLDKQAKAELNLANQNLKIAKQRQLVNGKSVESIQEIGDAEIKIAEIRERITSQHSEQLSNLNSLRREISAKDKEAKDKEAKEDIKREQEKAAAIVELQKERIKAGAKLLDDEKQRKIINQENELALEEQNIFNRLDLKRQELAEKQKLEIEFAEKIGADVSLINRKYADANEEISKAENDAKLSLAAGFFGDIATIAGEGTAVSKAAAVAETVINTYRSATAAFASFAGTGPVGVGLGIAAAAAAVASGLANVKKILSVKSGLPGDGGVSASVPSGGSGYTRSQSTAPSVNQGIVSRDSFNNNNKTIIQPPVLVENEVTVKQNKQLQNNETAVI